MIKCNNISKSYTAGTSALANINLDVAPGSCAAIIGASGAGKSSLLNIISGLDTPTSGEIIIDNQSVNFKCHKELRRQKRKIGFVAQAHNLLNSRSVIDNIYLALEVQKINKAPNKKYIEYLLDKVGLLDVKDSYPDQLSGGQRQRVVIARALATRPKLLLCDELTSALDTNTTNQVLKLLQSLQQELQFTLLVITHDLYVAKNLAQKIYVLDQGRVAEHGHAAQIFNRPNSNAAANLINAHKPGAQSCN